MTRAPGPRGRLLTGSLAAFQRDPLGLMAGALTAHGDVVRFRFAHVTAHLLNHPDAIEHVLSRNAANYDKNTRSAALIRATCGDSLMSGNETAWARHRQLLAPVFLPKAVAGYAALIDAHIQPMLDRWVQVAKAGGQIDIAAEMMSLVIGLAVRLLFSTEIEVTRIETALSVLLEDTWRRLQAPFDPAMISAAFHRRAFKDARAQIDAIVTGMIRARRAARQRPDDVLSRLIAAHESDGAQALSDTELRDAAVTLLLAGHETTANALAWMFWRIAQAPQAGHETADPQNLFAEALRLYPRSGSSSGAPSAPTRSVLTGSGRAARCWFRPGFCTATRPSGPIRTVSIPTASPRPGPRPARATPICPSGLARIAASACIWPG